MTGDITGRGRGLTLVLCCMSVLLVGIDMTAANVALPAIGAAFHTGYARLTWVVGAYALPLAAFLMFCASLADRIGRKRMFLIGLALFLTGSCLCGLAPGFGWLTVFRFVQGIGASALNPVAMAILSNAYPAARERARAIGIWAGATGLALALGPLVGGAFVSSALGWRWIFFINVPIGLLAIVGSWRVIAESKASQPRPFDPVGQGLLAFFLAGTTFAVMEGGRLGWTAAPVLVGLVTGLLALAGFLVRMSVADSPMLELSFFRSIPFSGANAIAVLSFAALASFLYLNSLYLQDVRGFSAWRTGLLMLPLAIASMVLGPINGRVLAAFGARVPLVVAGIGLCVVGLVMTRSNLETTRVWLCLAYVAMGVSNAAAGAPITHTVVSGMPAAQAGLAAGISSAARQIGQVAGIAVIGAIMAGASRAPVNGNQTLALIRDMQAGWWLVMAYGAAILLLGILITTRRATASAAVAGTQGSSGA